MSVGIGRILFFSVVSLSSLDEGHSIVSLKCWMPLRLTYIFNLCLYFGSALFFSGMTCWPGINGVVCIP